MWCDVPKQKKMTKSKPTATGLDGLCAQIPAIDDESRELIARAGQNVLGPIHSLFSLTELKVSSVTDVKVSKSFRLPKTRASFTLAFDRKYSQNSAVRIFVNKNLHRLLTHDIKNMPSGVARGYSSNKQQTARKEWKKQRKTCL